MRKTSILLLSFCLFFSTASVIHAEALITVTKDGSVRSNVLGDSIDITSGVQKVQSAVLSAKGLADATLSIVKNGEKSLLSIDSPQGSSKEDITKLTGNIVEVEQSVSPKSIKIGAIDSNFGISQSGITALTTYPIHIDASSKTISVATGSGERIIAIMPDDAVETLVRANIINTISKDGQMVLGEGENGELTYSIPAEREVNLFNIHTILVPVNTTVSATSGKVLKIDQPQWLKLFGFLFS